MDNTSPVTKIRGLPAEVGQQRNVASPDNLSTPAREDEQHTAQVASEVDRLLSTRFSALSVELSAMEKRSVERHQELVARATATHSSSVTSASAGAAPPPSTGPESSFGPSRLAATAPQPIIAFHPATPPADNESPAFAPPSNVNRVASVRISIVTSLLESDDNISLHISRSDAPVTTPGTANSPQAAVPINLLLTALRKTHELILTRARSSLGHDPGNGSSNIRRSSPVSVQQPGSVIHGRSEGSSAGAASLEVPRATAAVDEDASNSSDAGSTKAKPAKRARASTSKAAQSVSTRPKRKTKAQIASEKQALEAAAEEKRQQQESQGQSQSETVRGSQMQVSALSPAANTPAQIASRQNSPAAIAPAVQQHGGMAASVSASPAPMSASEASADNSLRFQIDPLRQQLDAFLISAGINDMTQVEREELLYNACLQQHRGAHSRITALTNDVQAAQSHAVRAVYDRDRAQAALSRETTARQAAENEVESLRALLAWSSSSQGPSAQASGPYSAVAGSPYAANAFHQESQSGSGGSSLLFGSAMNAPPGALQHSLHAPHAGEAESGEAALQRCTPMPQLPPLQQRPTSALSMHHG